MRINQHASRLIAKVTEFGENPAVILSVSTFLNDAAVILDYLLFLRGDYRDTIKKSGDVFTALSCHFGRMIADSRMI